MRIKHFYYILMTILMMTLSIDVSAQSRQRRPRQGKYVVTDVRLKDQVDKSSKKRQGRKRGVKISSIFKNVYAYNDIPTGMALVKRGHVAMGIEHQDSLWGFNAPFRNVSLEDFLLDRTEVTNAQYQLFIKEVMDSVFSRRLAMPEYNNDSSKVRASFYFTNAVTGDRRINPAGLNYRWQQYDYATSSLPKYRNAHPGDDIWISKDTAYYTADGTIVRETIKRKFTGDYDFLNTYIVNIFPDTTCWVNDFPMADMQLYYRYYFSHPDYQNYPVVGVSWEQANAYCAWRTAKEKKEMGDRYGYTQPYRLPTEAEWEHAAKGSQNWRYSWEEWGAEKGCYYANFMPDDGDMTADGNVITSRVATYLPNEYGLYDMAGNVAEWTSTAYNAVGVQAANNINPEISYHAAANDPAYQKRKSVRGGSWKDSERFVQAAWRTNDYQTAQHSYIGFRCAKSIVASPTGKKVLMRKSRARKNNTIASHL